MKKNVYNEKNIKEGKLVPRMFTYDQLVDISDTNYEVLNRSVDPSKLDKDEVFICVPLLIHHFAYGKPVAPHLRVAITSQNDPTMHPLQDMTYEQFEQGVILT